MKYFVDRAAPRPAYWQLYEQLRRDIVSGLLPYGTRLPSKRLLAEETGVSVITAEHAYAALCDEGYLEARQRSGFFVVYRACDFTDTAAQPPERRAPQPQRAERGAFPYSVLARTVRRVLQDYGARILVKSPNCGCPELRAELAAYLARSCGVVARPEQIVIGSGAEQLYSLIAQLFGTERVFALEEPSYEKIRQVYRAHGVRCELLPLEANGVSGAALAASKAGVLHVTPFNSYPSGVTADASKRQEYLRWAEARGGYLVEDNYDSELTVSRKWEETLFSLSPSGRVLYLNTFSQTIAPSLRAGYLVLPEGLLERFTQTLGFYSCTVPVLDQYVLCELLRSGDFERHVNRVRRARRRNAE